MKWYKKIEDLLHSELDNYSYFENWELNYEEENDDYEFYTVDIKTNDERTKTLRFRVNEKEIEIELGEDHWHKVNDYSFYVKYLWMALLSWEI